MNRFTARMIFHTPCLDMVEEVGLNFKRVLLSLKLDLIFFLIYNYLQCVSLNFSILIKKLGFNSIRLIGM